MNLWKVAFATLVIFVAGIVTGATLVRIVQGPRWVRRVVENHAPFPGSPVNPNATNNPRPPNTGAQPPGLLSREFIQVLERQLRLTPEQHAQIGKIMTEGQERVRELRSRIDPELRKEMQQTREQIRAVLTAEQREQFEQLMKRSSRRPERGEGPGQPDRGFRRQPPAGATRDADADHSQPLPPPPDQ